MTQDHPDRTGRERRDAQRILQRAAGEADAFALRRLEPPEADDWAERWGRRIGAVLGPLLLGLAALWLFRGLSSGAPAP